MSKRRDRGRRASRDRAGTARQRPRDVFVRRPFEGLADEPEWVALREFVPAATAPLRLAPQLAGTHGDRQVTLATLLPMAVPALVRPDGGVMVALQRDGRSGDVNRDVAAALLAALGTEPGAPVEVPATTGGTPRLAEVIEDAPLEITVHDSFDFWGGGDHDPEVAASLERANASIYPTVRMAAARAAYWCRLPQRAQLRWTLAEPEEAALPALARVRAADGMGLGDGSRFVGMFRAHGLLVPVWDLERETPAGQWEEPLGGFAQRYAGALPGGTALTAEQRRARDGLVARQLTLR